MTLKENKKEKEKETTLLAALWIYETTYYMNKEKLICGVRYHITNLQTYFVLYSSKG